MFLYALLGTLIVGGIALFLFKWLTKKAIPEPTNEQKIDTTLDEHEREIADFQKKVNAMVAKRGTVADEMSYWFDEITKFNNLTQIAVRSAKEADVAACVKERMEAERNLNKLKDRLDKLDSLIKTLKQQLQLAGKKVDAARSSKDEMSIRLEAAKIRENLADNNVDLYLMEDEVVKQEGRAEAYEETSPAHQAFKNDGVDNTDVAEEVQRLMKSRK